MKRRIIHLAVLAIVASVMLGLVHSSLAGENGRAKGKDRILSKVKFIHYRKGHAKPPWAGGGGGKNDEQGYYTYIAKGAKWRIAEPVLLNPNCDEGLASGVVTDAVIAGMDEWESAGDASLGIFGALYVDESVSYLDGMYRGHNTISFGPHPDSRVIGETVVWGYFSGKPRDREIVEAHILLNDHFVWGDVEGAADPNSIMDVQNIMTHELGHWTGMGDVYLIEAVWETMFGYSGEGEMNKRDLHYGDTTGITDLYK